MIGLLLLILCYASPSSALKSCENDSDCALLSTEGASFCGNGVCSNPFANGCLNTVAKKRGVETRYNYRVCNSNDKVEGDTGVSRPCRNLLLAYDEVRIVTGDWDGAVLVSWVYQILLSEVLNVPATIEFGNGVKGQDASFYDTQSRFMYATEAYLFDSLKEANKPNVKGDCTLTKQPCAHVMTEIWSGAYMDMDQAIEDGYALSGESTGTIGGVGLYIPKFAAEQDPTLMSFFGLQGEDNREKLANTFKTPTTWGQYCDENLCSSNSSIAKRSPFAEERDLFFAENIYRGHFRVADVNNCTITPNCTGHFIDGKCSWSTYAESQFYWNNISLASGGKIAPNAAYESSQMIQIWRASVETRSPVMMWWWAPSMMIEKYANTPGALQRVVLPYPSDDCINYRRSDVDKCNTDYKKRIGMSALGSCDYPVDSVKKLISKSLYVMTESETDILSRSPALDFVRSSKSPLFSTADMLSRWALKNSEDKEYAPRYAVCEWLFDNLDIIEEHLPPGFVRNIVEGNGHGVVRVAGLILGIAALIIVLIPAALTIRWRGTQVLRLAKMDILVWIISGFGIIVSGAIAGALEVSNITCSILHWTNMLGFTVVLFPIMIKVATINKIMNHARRFQHIDINSNRLDCILISTILIVALYLTVMTVTDPPKLVPVTKLHIEEDEISFTQVCSHRVICSIIELGWQAMLLICSTVLALQSRTVFEEFNEGSGLIFMIYSQFIFLLLRVLFYFMTSKNTISRDLQMQLNSISYSLDTIFSIIFYFGQKFASILSSKPGENRDHHNLQEFEDEQEQESGDYPREGNRAISSSIEKDANAIEFLSSIKVPQNKEPEFSTISR